MSALAQRDGRPGVAILGAGLVGGDLVHKLAERPGGMEPLLVADTDARAPGLASARSLGIPASDRGLEAILEVSAIRLVFDATTARAHAEHAPRLHQAGKLTIDLTPAALAPCVVPLVNRPRLPAAVDVSLGTSAAQATVPVARELAWLAPLLYVEVVSVLAAASVGPAAREDTDEATTATACALRQLGGAREAKAITILSPATPPVTMGCTLRAIPERAIEEGEATEAVHEAVADLTAWRPGYRLASGPRFETADTPWGRRPIVTLRVEVTGEGDPHAGSVDLMSACARDLAEELAWAPAPAEESLAVGS